MKYREFKAYIEVEQDKEDFEKLWKVIIEAEQFISKRLKEVEYDGRFAVGRGFKTIEEEDEL